MSRVDVAQARLASAYAVYQEARDRDNWYGHSAPRAAYAREEAEGELLRALLAYVLALALEAIRRVVLGLLVIVLAPLFWIQALHRLYLEAREWRRTVRALSDAFEVEVHAVQGKKGKR